MKETKKKDESKPQMYYTIITEFESLDLSTKVNQQLKDGWELHGGLVTHLNYLNQAMIKIVN